jgi:hypothetical protein
MFVTCSRCDTTFFLRDELFKPGRKARCSNCRYVFPMYVQPAVQAEFTEPSPAALKARTGGAGRKARFGKTMSAVFALAAAVLLVLLGYGGYLLYGALFSAPGDASTQPATEQDAARADYERRIKSIALEDIRQFHVDNASAGRLLVIQGLAVNRSDVNKDYIAVEASLLNADNTILSKAEQLCGVPLTLFQLQSLTPAELKEALNSRVTILTNNTEVRPGGKTPFVVIFPSPPKDVRTFEVRVIEARDSPVHRQDG